MTSIAIAFAGALVICAVVYILCHDDSSRNDRV